MYSRIPAIEIPGSTSFISLTSFLFEQVVRRQPVRRQENAKKKQKSATKVRDESLDALRKTMKKIRNKAKVIFVEKPAILLEFEPIAIKRSGKKQEPIPATTQKSKAATAEASIQK